MIRDASVYVCTCTRCGHELSTSSKSNVCPKCGKWQDIIDPLEDYEAAREPGKAR